MFGDVGPVQVDDISSIIFSLKVERLPCLTGIIVAEAFAVTTATFAIALVSTVPSTLCCCRCCLRIYIDVGSGQRSLMGFKLASVEAGRIVW